MRLTPEIASLKTCVDEWIVALPDPNAAMAAVVRIWALGGAAADDLLDDLERLATDTARLRGVELTAPELLDAYGQHERADRIRQAVEAGRAHFMDAAARAARLHDLHTVREAALV